MRVLLVTLLVLAPTALGAAVARHDVPFTTGVQAPEAPLVAGDIGAATIGASGADASVVVAMPLVADDILRLDSTDAAWSVRAELVSHAGWTDLLDQVTISLSDGVATADQILITEASDVLSSSGVAVDLPLGFDTEVRLSGVGAGSISFDLVLVPDGGGLELRYRIGLTVT